MDKALSLPNGKEERLPGIPHKIVHLTWNLHRWKEYKKKLLWFGIQYSHEQCLWKMPKCTFLRQVQRQSSDKKPPWQHCQYKDSCLSRLFFFFFLKPQFSTKGESSFLNRIFSNWRYASLHTRTVLEKCHKSQTAPVLQVPTRGILKDIGTFFFPLHVQ